MKKIWIRWLIVALTFVAAIFAFSIILNKGTTDMTIEMQDASLPVVSVLYGDKPVNTMHGYTAKIDCATVRDGISPIGNDRTLRFSIGTYNCDVTNIAYEVRNKDGSRLIEDTVVESYEQLNGKLVGTINIKDLIKQNEEYNLIFVLTLSGEREVYYYTRLIYDDTIEVAEKLKFIYEFNSKTFSSGEVKELSSYMETNSKGDNSSFGNVDIHSNFNQLSWGNMNPRIESDMVTYINDIGEILANVTLEYIVSVRSDNLINYYRIKESYVISEGKERYHLLSFNRTMDDIFADEKESLVNNKIVLGIQSHDVNMVTSTDGNIIALENCGRVYSYDVSGNKLTTLFSFFEAGDTDLRKVYNKSKAKILSVEENGNITFMVYGYMNRGTHEGKVGVLVDYYNSLLNTIEEQLFIEYYKSPEILITDVDKLSYLNSFNELFALIDGDIIKVDLTDLSSEVVADDVNEDTLHVSKSGKTAVWQATDEIKRDLMILDAKGGTVSTIEKKPSECIKPIGFMKEDLIYGISSVSNVIVNPLGDMTFPMENLIIRSEFGETLKEYSFEGIYITDGVINDNQLTLKRVQRSEDGTFSEILDDQITNNDEEEPGKNKIVKVATELFETIYQIELKSNVDTKTIKHLTPKEVLFEGGKNVAIDMNEDPRGRYYTYSEGHLISCHDNPGEAIKAAVDIRGIVIDNKGNEIYKRGETVARNQIMSITEDGIDADKTPMAICLDTMLKLNNISRNTEYMLAKGDTPYDIISNNLMDACSINMTGCSRDAVFYFLNKDIPVLVAFNDGSAILLIGYNEQNLVWYDPVEKCIYKKGINDSSEIFEANGNRFLTYNITAEKE